MHKYLIYKQDKSYKNFILNIKKYFLKNSYFIHKDRNEIKIISYQNREYVVKSFKIPHLLNKIIYSYFKNSKAQKSYENSIKIIDFTPKPIGYIEFKKFGLLDESYFINEKFDFDFTIREPLLDKDFKDKKKIFKEFAKFTSKLHQNSILHLDYSPGNILIKRLGKDFEFKIVDINRMKFKKLTLNERLKNFSKLWAKDEDLSIIVEEYSKLLGKNAENCVKTALYYSQKHKNFKNLKKKLKGEKVVD